MCATLQPQPLSGQVGRRRWAGARGCRATARSGATVTTRSTKRRAIERPPGGALVALGPADPVAPWPSVGRGAHRFPVRAAQYLLRAHQHHIAVDGVFGAETEAAVQAFQRRRGLVADGIVGPRTWRQIVVTVKRGSKGDAVRAVQESIRFHHQADTPPPAIDGAFGPRTDAWIRGFQAAVGTAPDGVVGPTTWRALVSGMLSG